MDITSLPLIDWEDLQRDRPKFIKELRHALGNIGFFVLTNHPSFRDDVQQRMFREARGFFESPDEAKATADISLTPYFRGWFKADLDTAKGTPSPLAQEAFQYAFECEPLARHDDGSVPLHRRVFRGPNTWPDAKQFPHFRPAIDELRTEYHKLTYDLGYLICESIGVDAKQFDQYFDFNDPDLLASLNHNIGMSFVPEQLREGVRKEFEKPLSLKTGAHIDGPPFVTLLINDRPGLQVVAGEGKWIDAPVTCRTKPDDYSVPVVPGSVVVNSGGMLMHLSKGKVVATLHRVNPMMVPVGDTRISMPFFLIPKMDGPLHPFVSTEDVDAEADTGYELSQNRGINASINRMFTAPTCRNKWWKETYKSHREQWGKEMAAEALATIQLAGKRAARNRAKL